MNDTHRGAEGLQLSWVPAINNVILQKNTYVIAPLTNLIATVWEFRRFVPVEFS